MFDSDFQRFSLKRLMTAIAVLCLGLTLATSLGKLSFLLFYAVAIFLIGELILFAADLIDDRPPDQSYGFVYLLNLVGVGFVSISYGILVFIGLLLILRGISVLVT